MKTYALILAIFLCSWTVSANQVSDTIQSKSSAHRAKILTNLLHKSDKGCGKVTRAFLQGNDKDDSAYWSVSCKNGQSYSIEIPASPSANSSIFKCEAMVKSDFECFKMIET